MVNKEIEMAEVQKVQKKRVALVWPEGVWRTEEEAEKSTGDKGNFLLTTNLSMLTEEQLSRFTKVDDAELRKQIELRRLNATLIKKMSAAKPRKADKSTKSKIVFAFLNGIRTEVQNHERAAEETGVPIDDETKKFLDLLISLCDRILDFPEGSTEEDRKTYVDAVTRNMLLISKVVFREKDGMSAIRKKLDLKVKSRERAWKKAAERKKAGTQGVHDEEEDDNEEHEEQDDDTPAPSSTKPTKKRAKVD